MADKYPMQEFDDWAANYDQSVKGQGFPFTGYEDTLDEIVKAAEPLAKSDILDLGSGTGNLSGRFVAARCSVTGVDFSSQMLEIARSKNPTASYMQADLREELTPYLGYQRFDRIVSAYTFHHFTLAEKYRLLNTLIPLLKVGGYFVIGDIAFDNDAAMQAFSENLGPEWEEEEYWLVDQALDYFAWMGLRITFTRTSNCAGVFKITLPS